MINIAEIYLTMLEVKMYVMGNNRACNYTTYINHSKTEKPVYSLTDSLHKTKQLAYTA